MYWEIMLFFIKNLMVFFGVTIIIITVHELGHYAILRVVSQEKPKIRISFKRGHKTSAPVPASKYGLIQFWSAINAIIYGYTVILLYFCCLLSWSNGAYYVPASIGIIVTYAVGCSKDLKNIQNYLENKKK